MSVEPKGRTPVELSRTRGDRPGAPDETDVANTSTPGSSGLAVGGPAGEPSTAVEREQGRQPSNAGRSGQALLTPDDLNATPPHGDVTPPHGDTTSKDR
jgi:hypothetical protein